MTGRDVEKGCGTMKWRFPCISDEDTKVFDSRPSMVHGKNLFSTKKGALLSYCLSTHHEGTLG